MYPVTKSNPVRKKVLWEKIPARKSYPVRKRYQVKKNRGIGDAGSTADFRMLLSAIVCLGLL